MKAIALQIHPEDLSTHKSAPQPLTFKQRFREPWHWFCLIFFFVSLVGGFFVSKYTSPFSNPDEGAHYLRAEEVSQMHLINRTGHVGILIKCSDYVEIASKYAPVAYFDPAAHSSDPACLATTRNTAGSYAPLPYLGAAVGLRVAGFFKVPIIERLQWARASTAAVCALICAIGLLLLPRFRPLAVVLLLTPMTVWQRSAISADGMTTSLIFLFLAYVVHLHEREARGIRTFELVILVGLGALVGSTKSMYSILCLASLALWGRSIASHSRLRSGLLLLLPFLVGAATNLAWNHFADRGLFYVAPDVSPKEQIAYCLKNPVSCLKVFVRTIVSNHDGHLRGLVAHFIWLPRSFEQPMVYAFGLLTFLTSVLSSTRWKWKERLVFIGTAVFCVLLIECALYATYTGLAQPVVRGLQGRYYIPPLMVASLGLGLQTGLRPRVSSAATWIVFLVCVTYNAAICFHLT